MNIAILSNVNLDLLIQMLQKKYEVFDLEGYGQWITYALTIDTGLVEFKPKIIFLLIDGYSLLETCDSFEDGKNEIDSSFGYIDKLTLNYPETIIVVSTIDIQCKHVIDNVNLGLEKRWEAYWMEQLNIVAKRNNNIGIFDLKDLIEKEGRVKVYSPKMWYMGSIPYSLKSLAILGREIDIFASRIERTRKKVLVLDLDNTLWGGVVGEDGPNGITLGVSLLGATYRDAQMRIKEINRTGVLLAIVSKNNTEDVDAIFKNNPNMVLKKEDFVSICTNWQPKFENIMNLATELNLGLDSFVFLDDNVVEQQAIRANLPEVTVIDFPEDIAMLPDIIVDIYNDYFWCWRQTGEDQAKTEQYHQEVQRKHVLSESVSIENYLKSLNIKIELGKVKEEQLTRAVQLLNKTNQFNTNTVRMDLQEFKQYLAKPNHVVLVATVSDKYGHSGLVVEILLHLIDETAFIDNFLMSCRVMGRQIEDAIINEVAVWLTAKGIRRIKSSFVGTAKNKPVEDLWGHLGFTLLAQEDRCKQYELLLPKDGKALLEVTWKG